MNASTVKTTKEVRGVTLRRHPAREACFNVVDHDVDMYSWPGVEGRAGREKLHRHMNNELGAIEIAAQCLVDFPDAPWELRMRLARQCADEARHSQVLQRRMVELGGYKGEFPVACFEWGVTLMLDDLPGRLAVQNRTFEAGLIDLLGTLKGIWREAGDGDTATALDAILADEITHVRFANRWIRKMTQENPRVLLDVAKAVRFLGSANAAMTRAQDLNKAGTSVAEAKLAVPIDVEGRLEAEFTEDEVLDVLKKAGFGSILPKVQQHGA